MTAANTINNSTPLIRLIDNAYPMFYRNLREDNPQTIFSSDTLGLEQLAEYGYAEVVPTDRPVADVVTEDKPKKDAAGVWRQTWVARAWTQEELNQKLTVAKTTAIAEANTQFTTELEIGFPTTVTVDGKPVVYHIQARGSDRINLLGLLEIVRSNIAAGGAEATKPIKVRVYENIFVDYAPADLELVIIHVLEKHNLAYTAYWSFKDAVVAASTIDQLPKMPSSFFDVK